MAKTKLGSVLELSGNFCLPLARRMPLDYLCMVGVLHRHL